MAQITVTDRAKEHVGYLLDVHPYQRPVFTIYLDKAQKDVRRGANGEPLWSTVGTSEWKANVMDWADMPGISIQPVSWESIEMAVTSHVEQFQGELVIDCTDTGFRVDARPI
jgi:hypothetical protein